LPRPRVNSPNGSITVSPTLSLEGSGIHRNAHDGEKAVSSRKEMSECNIHYVSHETASTCLRSMINPSYHTSSAPHAPMPYRLCPHRYSCSTSCVSFLPLPFALDALRGHNRDMGREENRKRQRIIKQLTTRLHREPTDDEIEKALAKLQEIHRKTLSRRPIR